MTERRRNEEQIQSLNRELRQRVQQLDESRRVVELRTIELQKLSGRLLQIQDEERRRIARELHDDLGQQLIALKMALPKFGSAEASRLTDAAISTVRNLSYLLHPPLLDESGLKAALHWYVEGMSKRSKISVSLIITPPIFPRLSRDVETTIFRVVQECLTNVYRHSKSDRARVEIEKQSEWVIVRIRDYGQGVPMNIESRMGAGSIGVGIAGMRERLGQFGGEITLSRAEPGTLVEARLPIFL
jgi:signal transduction histidine kinase